MIVSGLVLTINRVGFLGGVERVILGCARAVIDHGIQSLIACPAPGALADEARQLGIEVAAIGIDRSRATKSPFAWLRLSSRLQKGRTEIADIASRRGVRLLHAHHPIGGLYALHAARQLGLPLLLHVHETLPVHWLYRMVARQVIPHCAAIACVSEQSRALMLALGADPDRLQLIYNGVDPSFAGPATPVPELARPGPHIGTFGVLEPRKGQDVFIEACRMVAVRRPSAQFWIVGDQSFAEHAGYVAALREAIARAGLTDRVHLIGYQRNVRDWMAGMDAVVLASRRQEALPTVLIEAALLGRPLVATDVGGVREIVTDGTSGLVVEPGDTAALGAAIVRALGPEGAAFGKAARADAEQRFTFDRFGVEMAALYETLMADHGPTKAMAETRA